METMQKTKPILVVEDEAIMRESLRDWLADIGYKVETVEAGEEALQTITERDFGLLILDLRLPGEDGLEVLRKAREKRPQLKGVIITAYPSVETAVEAIRHGAIDYMPKPVDLNKLEGLIREALGPVQVEIRPTAITEKARVVARPHRIVRKEDLNAADYLLEVEAPSVAQKFQPGNFAVLLTVPRGERIPMSIQKAGNGNITMFIKRLGKTSRELDTFKVDDSLESIIGPLGNPVELKKYGNVVFASDLVCGHAENYALCEALTKIDGNHVISVQSFPTKDDIYPEKELSSAVCDEFYLTTKDGSQGIKGHYTDILKKLLDETRIDIVFAGGDIPSLRELARLTKPYNIPTIVTVRQIMVDATGMCGSCRVFVDGEMKLTCIDGPMFDAHKLNFEDIIDRLSMFKEKEAQAAEYYAKRGRR
jgi:ferredoxin--NADP+ reductase